MSKLKNVSNDKRKSDSQVENFNLKQIFDPKPLGPLLGIQSNQN